MDRSVPAVFALLGVLLGGLHQLHSVVPLVVDVSARSVGFALLLLGAVGFLLSPVAVVAAGYWAGGTVDVPSAWATLAVVAAAAGFAGYLVGAVGTLLVAPVPFGGGAGALALSVGYYAVTEAASVAVAAVAGAAAAHFRGVGPAAERKG